MGELTRTVDFDEQLEAITRVERRRLLLALLEADARDGVSVDVTDLECDTDESGYLTTMHHAHLPKLEALGLIGWNREGRAATRGPQFDEIEPLLRLLQTNREDLPDDLS